MPKCQFLFSAIFGFRNPSNEIFSESDEINAQVPIFPGTIQNTREPPEGSPGGPTPHPGAARGGAAPPYGVVAPGPLRGCPSAYLKPPSRKPYDVGRNPQKPPEPPPSRSQDLGDRSLCSGTLPEGEVPPKGFSIDTAAISTAIFITAADPMRRE